MDNLAEGLIYYVVFLFSTTVHEAAHAWQAKRGGDLTAYHGGQVSLDPMPHIRREPFGMVLLPLLTVFLSGWPFGYASAPYDPQWALRYPKRAAAMAAAGPISNFLLALVAALLIRAGMAAGFFYAPSSIGFGHIAGTDLHGLWPALAFFLGAMFSMNLLLGAFNLLPLPPLDGSALPLAVLHPANARAYQNFLWGNQILSIFGIMIAWKIFTPIFSPIFFGAIALLYPGMGYR